MSSQIIPFFQNQTIFLTGGTGFLGKVLLEKILRACAVNKIYLLVRDKKGKTKEERFQALFDVPCFARLKPEQTSKVHLICGDCQQPLLGISESDRLLLISEVTIVIHAAANVKFDQTLREAARNLTAAYDIAQLVKQMPLLTAFVHISTAYSNCIRNQIQEKIYEPPMTSERFFKLTDALDDDTLNAITPTVLGEWPNTYVYTKCIIEDMLSRECANLPLTIVRPAIVINAVKEPIPGWIDNLYGAVGIGFAAALGVLRSFHADPEAQAQIVPVDYVANAVLAAIWSRRDEESQLKIFNVAGNSKKKNDFKNIFEPAFWKIPSVNVVWYPAFRMRKNKLWNGICVFFLHTCLAHLADVALWCIGREPIAVKSYARLDKMLALVSYFTTRSWDMDDKNLEHLWEKLNEADRKLFTFDQNQVIFEVFSRNAGLSARKFLFHDPLETIPQGIKRMQRLMILHYTSLLIFWFLAYKLVTCLVSHFW